MNHLKLTYDILDIGKISEIVSAESCGAISIFVGTTRNSFDGKEVISLNYEAYEPMALKQLQLTCEQLRRQWPDIVNIAIYHRLGLVSIKEASVVIAISSPHRETSLNAVAVAIDDLKKRVPIWKKELYNEGTAVWKENKECQWLKKNSAGVDTSFNKTECFVVDPYLLPKQLVQISACEDEIARRIYCFVENKRHEIDQSNILDFTNVTQNEQEEVEEMACARISSNVTKQEYSKCHLKVRQVENNIGPQTRPNYFNTLDKLMAPINEKKFTSEWMDSRGSFYAEKYIALMERLENVQEHLDIPQDKIKSIYQFLKHIEDRLLNLESISPEYVHFLHENFQNLNRAGGSEVFHDIRPNDLSHLERKSYNVQEIDSIIQRFEKGKLDQSTMD